MIVFFDIDDTLIDSESAHVEAIRMVHQEFSPMAEIPDQLGKDWLKITDKYLKLYFENKVTLDQQRILRITDLWESNNLIITKEKAQVVYRRYHQLFLNACKAFPDVISSLKWLRQYRLGIISNGTYSDQIYKLQNNQLFQFFDEIIISEQFGSSKPDKEIFLLAARQAGRIPSDCIYIGNSYDLDYLGSLNSGMKGIWLDRKNPEANKKSGSIFSLNELIKHPYFYQ